MTAMNGVDTRAIGAHGSDTPEGKLLDDLRDGNDAIAVVVAH